MQFSLSKSGTVSEVREALNAELAKLVAPIAPEHFVIRAACHYVVETVLDPAQAAHEQATREAAEDRARGRQTSAPVEPQVTASISIGITTS